MGELIKRKVKGMNLTLKIALILIFTVAFSSFMFQGFYKPGGTDAAVTAVDQWTTRMWKTFPAATSWATRTGTFTVSSATENLFVAGYCVRAAANSGWTTATVRWDTAGGTPLIEATKTAGTTNRELCYLGYLTNVPSGTHSLYVNPTTTGNINSIGLFSALYSGVDQDTPTSASAAISNSAASVTVPFGTAVTTWGSGMTVLIGGNYGSASNMWSTAFGNSVTRWTTLHSVHVSWHSTMYPYTYSATQWVTFGGGSATGSAISLMAIKPACADSDLATITTDAPASSSTLSGTTYKITATIGTETAPSGMTNMTATIAGSDYCNGALPMTWNGGTSKWEVDWNIGNCGKTAPDTGITINVSGKDPDCANNPLSQAAQITNITIDNPQQSIGAIIACGGCHGNPPLDAATRDNATGRFPGSHATHVGFGAGQYGSAIACTDCHPSNTQYRHRNQFVDFTTDFGGVASGGKYSKAAGAQAWFTQSDTTSSGTCNNIYCHSSGTGWTSNTGETRNTFWLTAGSPQWGSVVSGCNTCHGRGLGTWNTTTGRPWYTNQYPKANSHYGNTHAAQPCQTCHAETAWTSTNGQGGVVTSVSKHTNRLYDVVAGGGTTFTYTYAATGGTCSNISCHGNGTSVWGDPNSIGCTTCHGTEQATSSATQAIAAWITSRDAVVSEFGQAWGHKASGRASVTDSDCIVCHLEGDWTTQTRSAKHGDGYIDLRDPDGTGEAAIKDMTGADYRFAGYWLSFGAGSRWTTTVNTTPYIMTQNFCVKCHDSNGATNTTARLASGTPSDQFMPWGSINLGAKYTTMSGSARPGGVVDVAKQFWRSNSSRHPVTAPNTRVYPYSNRLAQPYNNIWTSRDRNTMANNTATPRVKANSVVMVCEDCHNTPTPMEKRTVTAHGGGTGLRGTYFVSGPTLCLTCHIAGPTLGYNNTNTANSGHGTGSGYFTPNPGDEDRPAPAMNYCNFCHFSNPNTYKAAERPRYGQDIHGFNEIYGTNRGWETGDGAGVRPVAFMRNSWVTTGPWNSMQGNWAKYFSPRPYVAPGITAGQASCGGSGSNFAFNNGDSGISCSSNGHYQYLPGGSY